MRSLSRVLLHAVILGLVACGGSDASSSDSGTPDGGRPDSGAPDSGAPDSGPSFGQLSVTVTGVDGGADVLVTGPNGYVQHLTGSAQLANLAPGTYAFDAGEARISGAVVDQLADPTVPAPVTVTAGSTASASVAYGAPRTGTGMLWVPSYGTSTLGAYPADALLGDGGTPDAPVRLSVYAADGGGAAGPEVTAIDRQGRVWVTDSTSNSLQAFLPGQLGASSDAGAPLVISPVPLPLPDGGQLNSIDDTLALAFDATGSLWVANCGVTISIAKFTPDQLASSGAPTPAQIWTGDVLNCPQGLAFDHGGNLWVSQDHGVVLFEVPAAQLGSASFPGAQVQLVSDAGTTNRPENIAFDPQDTLWGVNCGTVSSLFGVSPASRADSGTLVPDVVLTNVTDGGTPSFECATGLAFDNGGNAWVSNDGTYSFLAQFTPGQLAASAQVQPNAWIQVPAFDFGGISFYPAPSWSPLYR